MLDTFKYHPMKLFFISFHEVGCAVKKSKKKKAKNYSLCLNKTKNGSESLLGNESARWVA